MLIRRSNVFIKYDYNPFYFHYFSYFSNKMSNEKSNENKKGMASAMPYSYLVTLTYKGKIIT